MALWKNYSFKRKEMLVVVEELGNKPEDIDNDLAKILYLSSKHLVLKEEIRKASGVEVIYYSIAIYEAQQEIVETVNNILKRDDIVSVEQKHKLKESRNQLLKHNEILKKGFQYVIDEYSNDDDLSNEMLLALKEVEVVLNK